MKRISGLAFACPQSWPVVDFFEMFVFVVCCVVFETLLPRLPRESSPSVESDMAATQKTAAPHQSQNVAKLLLTSMEVQKAPCLPRKSSSRC